MEKFGIFELLDTLSALTAANGSPEAEEKAEYARPETGDASFAPPAYGAPSPAPSAPPPPDKNTSAEQSALAALLARHDALSKKIDKKK